MIRTSYILDMLFIDFYCHNCVVLEWLTVDINNSDTIIDYKLIFNRSRFCINIITTGYNVCLHNGIATYFTLEQ